MGEKDQQVHPLAPAKDYPRSDEESARLQSKELKRKKRIKCALYVAAFAGFQTAVRLVFALTVMRVKNPKVTIGRVTIETMETNNTGATAASFDLNFIAQVTVENSNFGHFRFDNSTLRFLYDGAIVGEAIIPKARAKACSTKRLDVAVGVNSRALTSSSTTGLGSELSSNVSTLNSQAKLRGRVKLLKVMKQNKSPEMNCTLTFNVSARNLQELKCK